MTSMREQFPEAMALADLCNATADGARAVWFAFLAFLTFLALAVFGTSHRDLFLGTPLALPPPISIEIDLVGFYVVAPLILTALHKPKGCVLDALESRSRYPLSLFHVQ